MASTERAQPQLALLTEDQIQRIHEQSLQILATTGMRVDAPWAREALVRAGAPALTQDNIVRLPGDLVEWALRVSPAQFDIHDQHGQVAFRLGQGNTTRFGIGVTTLYYQDPATNQLTQFTREHLENVVRLGHTLRSFDVISTVGIVQDTPPDQSDLYATLHMVAATTKPLVLLVSDEARFPAVLDLVEHLRGDLATFPCVIPYVNPITPLILSGGTADKMRHTIRRGLPLIFSSYGMAGATTPIPPLPRLALLNAELLAGLTLAQTVREGTPVILGLLPAYFHMRGKDSAYDATSYLLNLACAEMMSWYQLPHSGASGSGMGWGPDLLTAGHQWANHLTSCLGKASLVPFVGDTLGSKAFSPASIVYANEVIAQCRDFAAGLDLETDPTLLEEIAETGPGGSFLLANSTLERMHSAHFQSEIFPSLTLDDWQAQNRPQAQKLLRDYTQQLIDGLQPAPGRDDLIARGTALITHILS